MSRFRPRTWLAVVWVLALAALPCLGQADVAQEQPPESAELATEDTETSESTQRKRFRKGAPVSLYGQVLDTAGFPLPGLEVVLRASRTRLRFNTMTRERDEPVSLPTTVGADGRWTLAWPWNSRFDRFELAVAVPTVEGGRPGLDIFHTVDVTDAVLSGGPVERTLTVEVTPYIEWLRRFHDGRASADEQRVFQEMGPPERFEGPDPTLGETTWWYFASGKAYRFKDGTIQQVTHFDPIPGSQ